MKVVEREAGACRIVAVSDVVANPDVREFTARLDAVIDSGVRSVVLDLREAAYVTSRGLGAIVGAYTVLRRRGGNLVLLGPQAEVRRSLELTRLDRILDIAASEAEAVLLAER